MSLVSESMPSATVMMGLASTSACMYSPIRNVVACQLVMRVPSSWMKYCKSLTPSLPFLAVCTTERNESTNTSAGENASTSRMMRSSTPLKSPARKSSARFT